MRKVVFFSFVMLIAFIFSISFLATQVEAKHQVSKASKKSPALSAIVAKNKRSTTISFSNLSTVKSVSYTLVYNTSDKGQQGASGSLKVGKRTSESRKLLFGTCSSKVCTYHKGVNDIKISADFLLKTGGVVSFEKSFK